MFYLLMSLFSMGLVGGVIIVLLLAGLFIVGASTFALFTELFRELGHPLEFEGMSFLIAIFVVAIVLFVLSSLGPLCSAIGKSFIIANFIIIIGNMVNGFIKVIDDISSIPSLTIIAIISLIIGFKSTDDVWDLVVDSPILSILSAIPSSFFIFIYIWLMKEELNPRGSMIAFAKESLVISLIVFAVFTSFEIVNIVKNKS